VFSVGKGTLEMATTMLDQQPETIMRHAIL
jgi:hypothetical protein